MPTTAANTFTNDFLVPAMKPESAVEISVKLAPSATYARGQVLGEQSGNNEVQTVTLTGTPTGGTFTLTYAGQTTAAIAYNATAAAVAAALAALSNVGANNVAVTGGPGPGTPYVVTFQNALGRQNVANMTATGSFTGGSSPAVAVAETTPGAAGTPGQYAAYAAGASDGSQVPQAVLKRACVTDGSGNVSFAAQAGGNEWGVTYLTAPVYVRGVFFTQDLAGLDEAALAKAGWSLKEGTVNKGLVSLA